jgi:hypothetical protein
MVYSADTPYELLCNKLISFASMQRVRRFAKYWNLVANSGNYLETVALLLSSAAPRVGSRGEPSRFWSFMRFSDWAFELLGRTDSISLMTWAELLYQYLTETKELEPDGVKAAVRNDFARLGRTELPKYLLGEPKDRSSRGRQSSGKNLASERQQRHLREAPSQ